MQFHRERQFLPEFFSQLNWRSDAMLAIERYGCVWAPEVKK